ncbi:hypothetical protein LWP59_11695 [Amycolatopsis acidiphila]|uniref:hypothetical protein n=1 Tax=Amycolatopsis acidiphila TaxID=715473 RepID=UPI001643E5E8|nr:hypothetical protein [Amycolatopsis acidiphila]UIJ62228.1 hypothetical protein LWP59_11695 [Amycolatopsis acidiphila]GHG92746.1 hypothetical protein GCM10017788_69750 [Amycolatopsis acidiphila]
MNAVEVSHPPAAVVQVLNRVLLAALRTPLGKPVNRAVLVLRFTGRRTGRRYDVPVTAHRNEGSLMVLTSAPWRVNFRGGRDVDVTFEGRTTPMRGVLVEYARTVAETYARRIEELGVRQAQRQLGIRINVPRVPTTEELVAAVERERLSIIWLKPRTAGEA